MTRTVTSVQISDVRKQLHDFVARAGNGERFLIEYAFDRFAHGRAVMINEEALRRLQALELLSESATKDSQFRKVLEGAPFPLNLATELILRVFDDAWVRAWLWAWYRNFESRLAYDRAGMLVSPPDGDAPLHYERSYIGVGERSLSENIISDRRR